MDSSAAWSTVFVSFGLLLGGVILAMMFANAFDPLPKWVQMLMISLLILLMLISWGVAGSSDEFVGNFSSSVLHVQNAEIVKKSVDSRSRDIYEIWVQQHDIHSHSVFNNKNFEISGDFEFVKNSLHVQSVKGQKIKKFDKVNLIKNPVLAMITMEDGAVSIARVKSITSGIQHFAMEFYEAQEFHGMNFSCNSNFHFSCIVESKKVSSIEFFLSGDLDSFRQDAPAFTESVMKIAK